MKLKTFFEKFDQFADAPNAIPAMRELILQLAVRGNLTDRGKGESSDAQLKLAEAFRLDRNRRGEPDADDIPFPIPEKWGWVAVGDSMHMINGKAFKPDEWSTEGTPIIRIQNLNNENASFNYCKADLDPKIHVNDGEFLISWSGTPGTSFGAFIWHRGFAYLNQHIFRCELVKGVFVKEFLRLAINARLDEMISHAQGAVGLRHITKGKLESIRLPLPPLAEQKRIVAKVDELMALCDRLEAQQQKRDEQASALARASLARFAEAPTPANLNLLFHKSYSISPVELRKAILTLAVQGKLVTRCPLPPPSDELKVAKRKLSEKEGIRNRAEVVRLDRAEWGHPIPKHWDLPNFDDLLVIVSGVTKGRVLAGRKTETVPYLRVANVQRGYLDLNVMKEIEVLPDDENRYRLETGDVLMTEGGDWDKVGRAAVWRSEIDRCIHQNHVYRIRSPRKDLLLPEWVECYVNSPVGRSFFEAASKQTTNLASINMTQLRGCPLPLPPSEEQNRIVAKVNQLMILVDQLEEQLAAARDASKNLLEALVTELTCPH